MRLPVQKAAHVVARELLEKRQSAPAVHLDLSHVTDIEQARAGADSEMLRHDAGVLDGHLPAGESDQARASFPMDLVERRPFERLFARQSPLLETVGEPGREPSTRPLPGQSTHTSTR